VCQFPCEWDATDAEKKWGWLKGYFKNPATLKKELAEKHKRWIEAVKTRTENRLKTAQGDLKTAQEAKKEKQTAAAEQQKKIAELAKQITAGEAQIKVHDKELTKLNKNHYAKPEDKEKAQKQLDDERKALDEKKTAKQQEQNALGEAGQQLEDLDVVINKLEAKIKDLDATLKAVPKAVEAADNDIKAAEVALKSPPANSDPEKSWKEFKAHMEALQWWDKVKPLASASVWHFHPLVFINHFKKCHWLSKEELKLIYKDTDISDLERYRTSLNKVMYKYGVSTPVRMAHFLGQGAQESGSVNEKLGSDGKPTVNGLTSMIEASNAPYRKGSQEPETNGYYKDPQDIYYTHIQSYAHSNGNIEQEDFRDKDGNPVTISGSNAEKYKAALKIDRTRSRSGDGIKFRGRGMKQLTGRYNYAMYWVYRGWLDKKSFNNPWWNSEEEKKRPPIINDPEKISIDPYNCIDAGGWYWTAGKTKTINETIGNAVEVTEAAIKDVTKAINGAATEDAPSFLKRRRAATNHADSVLNDKV
jgi:predicted chitinase/predicted  nucleic acid-binding Zn-ribbon protein